MSKMRYFQLEEDKQFVNWYLGAPWMNEGGKWMTRLTPDDVRLIPVDVQGQPDQYLILVATKLIRCIDDKASREVRYWKPEHGQPERVGDYKSVIGLRIDPTKVGEARVFRTWGWDLALIVSEDIKQALERARVTGAQFVEV